MRRRFKMTKTERLKKAAWQMVFRAERDGRLIKPKSCEFCGRTVKSTQIFAHHEDYTIPLDVHYLCDVCHKKAHDKDPGLVTLLDLVPF